MRWENTKWDRACATAARRTKVYSPGVYIYVFQDGARVKVGLTGSVAGRFTELRQTGIRDLKIIRAFEVPDRSARVIESLIHRVLRRSLKHQHGEWYYGRPIVTARLVQEQIEMALPLTSKELSSRIRKLGPLNC